MIAWWFGTGETANQIARRLREEGAVKKERQRAIRQMAEEVLGAKGSRSPCAA